jgi:phage antirepressor YoqD-like protein
MKTDQIIENFETFTPDGLELVVNTTTGMAFATLSATSRMLGLSKSTTFAAFGKVECFTAQIESGTGIRTVRMIGAVTLYDMASEYNPELAKQMGRIGANLYLLNRAGYKVTIKEVSKPELPTNMLGWMKLAVQSEERAEAERERAETEKIRAVAAEKLAQELSEHIEENTDATAHGNAVSTTSNCRDIGSFGKSLAVPIGRTTFYRLLRTLGFIQANNAIPYMKHVNSRLFEVIEVVTKLPSGNTRTDLKALISGKGELAVIKAMEKMEKKEQAEVQMEKEVVMVD